jgi:uncharacterized Tic20 family protein
MTDERPLDAPEPEEEREPTPAVPPLEAGWPGEEPLVPPAASGVGEMPAAGLPPAGMPPAEPPAAAVPPDELPRTEQMGTGTREQGAAAPPAGPRFADLGAGAPSNEDRTFAALAHASGLLNLVLGGFGGMLIAGVIWLVKREQSAWVGFHAAQSFVFQLAVFAGTLILAFVGTAVIIPCAVLTFGIGAILTAPFVLVLLALMFGGALYGLYGAWQVYEGRPFRYPWIGDWVAGQMSGAPLAPGAATGAASGTALAGGGLAAALAIACCALLALLPVATTIIAMAAAIFAAATGNGPGR